MLIGLGPGGGREGGSPTAVQRLRTTRLERGTESDVELDVGAGPRQKTGWNDQEEQEVSGLGVSLPTRSYLLQNLGYSRPRDFCCAVVVCCQQIFGEAIGTSCDSFLPAPSAEVDGLSVCPVILLFKHDGINI